MIGILAVSQAPGQAILMVIFLIFTVLYQITLGRALDPLLYNMPCTIQSAEDKLQSRSADGEETKMMEEGLANVSSESESIGKPAARPNFVQKFFRPWVFADYWTLRDLVSKGANPDIDEYEADVDRRAYLPPSVANPAPELWLPQDGAGISRQEVIDTRSVIAITDEGCTLSAKNRIEWDMVEARPPLWRKKVVF